MCIIELSMKGDKEKIVLTAYVPIKTYNNKKMYADQDSSIESNKDKTLILQQFQEYKSRIKEIQLKHEQYKKDKQNLLEELNCKERYIEEMKTKHQQEIQNLSLQIKEINQKDDKQRDMMQCPLLSPPHENIKTIKSEPTTPYYEQDPVLSINEHERRIIQQLRYDHAQEIQQLQQRWEAERAAQLQKFRDIQERDHADVIALVNALAAEKTQLLDQLTQVKNDLSNNSLFSYHHDDKETRLLNKEINILQIHTVQMEEEKDDLQNEIGQLKADRDKIYKDFINFKRETNEANLELLHLHNDDTISLVDLLKRTLGNITNLQAHNNNLEESMESAYMTGMYPY
ncbi:uncharacterized protein BX663DRAFT_252503 [Cokeromyces recurvatus]|uniref:uncharacterized protein n=1 Tax=Cokeromyces recurvatus TaxID=90255 RepID=UPI00221FF119|nr:uncharacterized protein BX663DRAFT_252503 [Cokeromyces recurvatus]KAI7906119.1 hypothetical protein BX663DRAFT_252503 [Cokeromyces recurvatus]